MKKVLKAAGLVVLALVACLAVFVAVQVSQFNTSIAHVYDVPPPTIARSTDAAVIARGAHLSQSLAGCALADCHGADMGGGRTLQLGPLGSMSGPNVTLVAQAYSDGELARLIREGVRHDGRSVRFMPVADFNWLPDSDVAALVSWVRTLPVVSRPSGPVQLGLLGKVLDRRGLVAMDVARRISHPHHESPPPPAPTAAYGHFVGRLCNGCHGDGYSGGPIPGAPPSMAVPRNITPDASGIASWTYDDFVNMARTGRRKNGDRMDPLMPVDAINNMDETERRALWAFLRELPPRPFGGR